MIRIEIFKQETNERVGTFYIPTDVSKKWIEKTIPIIIQAARLLAEDIKETGY